MHVLTEKGFKKLVTDLEMLPKGTPELFKAKDYTKCLRRCSIVLRKDPYNIAALLYKSLILKDRKKLFESNQCLDLFLNQFSTFPFAHQYQTENYLKLKEYDKATDSAKRCLRLSPQDPYIWSLLCISTFLEGKTELAYMLLEEAEKHVTENKDILYLVTGLLKERDAENDEAMMNFIKYQKLSKHTDELIAEKIYKMLQ